MFEAFTKRGKKQKCSIRHAEPGYVRASKRASRALTLNLQTLKEVAAPIRTSLSNRPDEKEILRSAGKVAVSEVSTAATSESFQQGLGVEEVSDYRPPRPLDLD